MGQKGAWVVRARKLHDSSTRNGSKDDAEAGMERTSITPLKIRKRSRWADWDLLATFYNETRYWAASYIGSTVAYCLGADPQRQCL